MPGLAIFSDVICPWCYIGKQHMRTALNALADDGLTFDTSWRPFQLNPDMPRQGMPRDAYRAAKFGSLDHSRALDAKVTAAAQSVGLDIRFDRIRTTPNTLDAHRLIAWAEPTGLQDALVDRLFAAYFVQGLDIGDPATLADVAAAVGLQAAAEFLAGDHLTQEVLAEDSAARNAGVDAVPTFVLGRYVLFSGAVPADVFAELVTKAHNAIGQAA